jgi:Trk K+ transport system NAD-binding subunit
VSEAPFPENGHVIVCGLEGVGLRTVEQLVAAGASVIVVDDVPDRRLVRQLDEWGVPLLEASARRAETLRRAGLAGAEAVVCAEHEDVHTLEITLLVRQLRPDVRVVVSLNNPSVGAALEEVTGPGSVLSTAALAAPSLVEDCLRSARHDFTLSGVPFGITTVPVRVASTLRRQFGDLAPICVAGLDGLEICPGRDHPVRPGDRVTVLGPRDDLPIPAASESAVALRGDAGTLQRGIRTVRGLLSEIDRPLRLTLLVFLLLAVLSTTVLALAYRPAPGRHLGPLDALYFTVVTDATVGYGDFHFSDQSAWLETFGIVDIVLGAALATAVFAQVTNLLVNRRLAVALGRQRLTGMRGHVVVIGLGSIGVRVAEGLLARGRDVVVVERHEENRFLNQVRGAGIPVVLADAAQTGTFDLVNLDEAAAVAILTSDDLTNIEVGLAVRERLGERWQATPVVLRVLDRSLATTVESTFGFRHVRSTSALAAPWFVGAALGLHVLDTFYIDHQPFLLGRLSVGGGLAGTSMQELSARTRVIAIRRAAAPSGLEHPPRRGTRFERGDEAFLVGPYEELLRVLAQDRGLTPPTTISEVMPTGAIHLPDGPISPVNVV